MERARNNMDNGDGTYNCPFNDPKTGKCDIYEDRFYVCAAYAVFNPIEMCNSKKYKTGKPLQVANPADIAMELAENGSPVLYEYMKGSVDDDGYTCIFKEFRKRM